MNVLMSCGAALSLFLLGLALPACSSAGPDLDNFDLDLCADLGITPGELTSTDQSKLTGSCLFCAWTHRIAVPGKEILRVTTSALPAAPDEAPSVRVESSDPSLLRINQQASTCAGSGASAAMIEIETLAEGDVRLLVLDEGGKEVDAIPLELVKPTSVYVKGQFGASYKKDFDPAEPVLLKVGEPALFITIPEGRGAGLYASLSIEWTLPHTNVLHFNGIKDPAALSQLGSDAVVKADAPGTAVLTVNAYGLEQMITIQVSPADGGG
jgi:hypothetical protein